MDMQSIQAEASSEDAKEYIDRAVQTDTPTQPARSPSPEHSTSMIIHTISEKCSDMDISSSSNNSLSSCRVETNSSFALDSSAYSHEDSSILVSPPPTIKTTTRIFKRSEVISGQSTRLVSLPETVSTFSARRVLEKTPRVVSNPEGFARKRASLEESYYAEDILESERPTRVRVRTTATEAPHTPSPPSSPDSIEIIANTSCLPDNFLRRNAGVEESPRSSEPDDDGKIGHDYDNSWY